MRFTGQRKKSSGHAFGLDYYQLVERDIALLRKENLIAHLHDKDAIIVD